MNSQDSIAQNRKLLEHFISLMAGEMVPLFSKQILITKPHRAMDSGTVAWNKSASKLEQNSLHRLSSRKY